MAMPPPPAFTYSFSRPPGAGGVPGAPATVSAAAHPDTIGQAASNSFGAEAPAGNRFTASTGKNTVLGG